MYIVFDGDLFCGAFMAFDVWFVLQGRRCALPQPSPTATKSALLLPMSWAYEDRCSKGHPRAHRSRKILHAPAGVFYRRSILKEEGAIAMWQTFRER